MRHRMIVVCCLVGPIGIAAADDQQNKELADLAKTLVGKWTCKGNVFAGPAKPIKFEGKMTTRLDIGNKWLHESMDAGIGEGKTAISFRYDAFLTFNAATKKWRRIELTSFGDSSVGTSDGPKDGKIDWTIDLSSGDGTTAMERGHLDISDLKKGSHISAEVSPDKGKTWNPIADVTCKK